MVYLVQSFEVEGYCSVDLGLHRPRSRRGAQQIWDYIDLEADEVLTVEVPQQPRPQDINENKTNFSAS